MRVDRWYVRCRDCLSVAGVDARPAWEMECGLCLGRVEVMGQVRGVGRASYLVTHVEHLAPCDARCTNASGPSCDCPCGGKNHGTGRVVAIEHGAKLPRVSMPSREEALERAREWKTENERARTTGPGQLAASHAGGNWLSRSDWEIAERYRAIIHHARSLRTHRGRMALLRRIQQGGIAAEATTSQETT